MNREIDALIKKAEKFIKTASLLIKNGDYDSSVSRSYYAMFYLAEAMLLKKGLSFSKHSAVIAAFGKHFAKTNLIDKKFHKYLIDAFAKRQIGDYEYIELITEDEAKKLHKKAEEFFKGSLNFLKE